MSKHARTFPNIALVLIIGALLALVSTGCGGSEETPAPEPEKKAEPAAKPAPVPAAEPAPVPKLEPEAAPKPEAEAGEAKTDTAAGGEAKAEGGGPSEADKGPEKVEFDSKKGKITFPHHVHHDIAECKDCHHKAEAGKKPNACRDCHGKKDDAPKMMKAAHKVCRDCHKEQGGPTKCDDCHKK